MAGSPETLAVQPSPVSTVVVPESGQLRSRAPRGAEPAALARRDARNKPGELGVMAAVQGQVDDIVDGKSEIDGKTLVDLKENAGADLGLEACLACREIIRKDASADVRRVVSSRGEV